MSYWIDNSKKNLLARSVEKNDFHLALQEWEHTGNVIDHGGPVAVCQLCEHPQLRYQYEVTNGQTGETMMVGSECIAKFGIAVFDEEGNLLTGNAVSEQLRNELQAKQKEMMLEPLRQLWQEAREERSIIKESIKRFEKRNGFSPAQLLFLFREMHKRDISFRPDLYKVSLRSNTEKEEVGSLSEEDVALIWPSLSNAQKQRYKEEKDVWAWRTQSGAQAECSQPACEQEELKQAGRKPLPKQQDDDGYVWQVRRVGGKEERIQGRWVILPSGKRAFIPKK